MPQADAPESRQSSVIDAPKSDKPKQTSPTLLPTIASKHKGRVFRTVKNFGPWKKADPELGGKPNVFNESEFARLHPIPEKATDIDPATYHDDLLDRGLALGAIVFAPDAEVTPTPLGPGNSKREGTNPIRESTASVLAQQVGRKAAEAVMDKKPDDAKK